MHQHSIKSFLVHCTPRICAKLGLMPCTGSPMHSACGAALYTCRVVVSKEMQFDRLPMALHHCSHCGISGWGQACRFPSTKVLDSLQKLPNIIRCIWACFCHVSKSSQNLCLNRFILRAIQAVEEYDAFEEVLIQCLYSKDSMYGVAYPCCSCR